MQTLKELRDYVSGQIGDTSTDALEEVDRWINIALRKLCDKFVWAGYKKDVTITPDVNGELFVPPSFGGVVMLWPENNNFSYFDFHTSSTRRRNRGAKAYYMNAASRTVDGASEDTIAISNGDTTLTTTGSIFASTDVGSALLIGAGYEYEITSYADADNIGFSPAFRGEDGTYRIVVRPAGVRKLVIYGEYDLAYTNDVVLSYKIIPQLLYNDYDRPLIDADGALRKGALIEALVEEKYNVDAERTKEDYDAAVANARNSEIRPVQRILPEGLFGGLGPFSLESNKRNSGSARNDKI